MNPKSIFKIDFFLGTDGFDDLPYYLLGYIAIATLEDGSTFYWGGDVSFEQTEANLRAELEWRYGE